MYVALLYHAPDGQTRLRFCQIFFCRNCASYLTLLYVCATLKRLAKSYI